MDKPFCPVCHEALTKSPSGTLVSYEGDLYHKVCLAKLQAQEAAGS